eukprot:CAMPEP_0171420044 /NCGR_PEP_ID=MMETSP0880-20121228/41921_1 /TAXON_ID=67004 /ORGANISM="Thalassiosira weissflogii, Strain CCMP1336" /LENGTH=40 /DNA_ID= /DNA_START= /DNA_END= /DNA_ORIENTATION=
MTTIDVTNDDALPPLPASVANASLSPSTDGDYTPSIMPAW